MIYRTVRILLLMVLFLVEFSCKEPKKLSDEEVRQLNRIKDPVLKKILTDRKLIATTDYNSIDYFVYRGEPMGYQYELLKAFTDYLNVKLEITIINDLDESIDCIKENNCDLIAVGLTVTKDRSSNVDFTIPIGLTRQMLVQRKPALISNTIDLAGKTIYIEKGSTYETRLKTLSDEIGADIDIQVHNDATVEELIEMVAKGEINYTVSDENVALVNQKYYSNIDVNTPIKLPAKFSLGCE